MSRKHFRMTAATVAQIKDPATRKRTAETFAAAFRLANPRFDARIFYSACNVEASP